MSVIAVIVPVYKAENCLDELYRRLVAALETITPDFEIVLVEDCGGDRSWEIIERLAAHGISFETITLIPKTPSRSLTPSYVWLNIFRRTVGLSSSNVAPPDSTKDL